MKGFRQSHRGTIRRGGGCEARATSLPFSWSRGRLSAWRPPCVLQPQRFCASSVPCINGFLMGVRDRLKSFSRLQQQSQVSWGSLDGVALLCRRSFEHILCVVLVCVACRGSPGKQCVTLLQLWTTQASLCCGLAPCASRSMGL